MPVLAGAEVAAHPFDEHARREGQDDHADGRLGARFEPEGERLAKEDQRQPHEQEHPGMANAPPRAEPRRAARAAVVGGDERGDGDQVVRVRREAQAEQEPRRQGRSGAGRLRTSW